MRSSRLTESRTRSILRCAAMMIIRPPSPSATAGPPCGSH